MDSSIINTDQCSSVANQTLETSVKLPNLDMKCHLADRTERKINLYTKRTASQTKRCFQKMEKRTSFLLSPAIEDWFTKTSPPRAKVEGAKDDLEVGLNCEYLDSVVMPRKCITPVPEGFIRGMVERFDNQSETVDKIVRKTGGKTSQEGMQNITKNCIDSLQSTENTCLAVSCNKMENICQRVRSKSENVAEHSEKRVHHSRSDKPATPPKPKSRLKSKLHAVDYKSEDLELNGSALTESKAILNCCTEIANSCDSENVNSSTCHASSSSSLTTSASLLSCDNKNEIPTSTCVSDCDLQKCTERTSDDDFTSTVGGLNAIVTEVDILSSASHLGSEHETDDGEWGDTEASESIQKQVKKKKTRHTAHSNSSSSSVKNFVLKNSLSQKVTTVPSSHEGPSQMKVIYVNETESDKDQASVAISSSDHLVSGVARGGELNQDPVEKMHDLPQAEEPSSAVFEQGLSMTNDSDPLHNSGSIPSCGLDVSDSDELLYEILPYRFNQEHAESFNYNEPIYEISPMQKTLDTSTQQLVPNDTSSVPPQATDVSACVPLVPARPIVHPDMPSPLASPTPAPRKTSKGHIDVGKLTQLVLPPSPAPNLSLGSSPNPPMTVPRVPPRVSTSQSVHGLSTPVPLVLPRKRSDVQTIYHTKSRRLPPPPMPPLVPESLPPATGVPALPERSIKHHSPVSAERYASSRSGKRPSVGMLRGYEAKCVEVDSGNPSKPYSKPTLSNASSRSMNDLLKTAHNRGSTLSLHVPPPSEDDIEGNGSQPLSPSRSEGYLQQNGDGYLPMGSQRSSSISSQLSSASESLEQNFAGASDGVPNVPPRHTRISPAPSKDKSDTRTSDLEKIVKRDNSYLDLVPDEDYTKYAYLSLYAESEPYQIYHQTAVVRQVIEQNLDTESDYDSYYSPQDYVEHAKLCVNDILNRDSGKEQLDNKKVIKGLSTLESAARLGTGFRKLWCEMPKVKESGLLDHMILEERRLQESLFEILSSEASYLKSLNLLVGHFMGILAIDIEDKDKHHVLTKQDFNWLFSNAKAVRDACIKMLEALEDLWQEGCAINPLRLCSMITEVVQEHYGVYVTYCSNAIYQERKLRELTDKSAEFRYTVRHLEDSADCHSLPLHSFLALPMQRITRMPLLVSAMCRYLKPDEASSLEVTRCIQTLQKVVKQCNEGARRMSNLEQMNDIEKVLDFRSVKKIPLISKSRFLVKKGCLVHIINQPSGFIKKSKRTLFFFLFNDLLVVTKKKSEKQYEVLEYCSRSRIHTEPITDENMSKFLPYGAPGGCRNLFNMVLIDRGVEFVLSCESQSEQQRWIQAVTPVEHTSGEEVIYMDWDCPQVQAVMQYVATEPDELSLEESDIVNVLRKENDGWYEGERIRDGERGWFLAHCTVEIQNEHVRARNLRQRYQLMKKSGNTFSVTG